MGSITTRLNFYFSFKSSLSLGERLWVRNLHPSFLFFIILIMFWSRNTGSDSTFFFYQFISKFFNMVRSWVRFSVTSLIFNFILYSMIYHLTCPKLINKLREIMYVFKPIFINVYTLVLRVIHGSFSTSLGAFSWIQLANSFHSNHPPYMSYENHDLYKFVHVRIQP